MPRAFDRDSPPTDPLINYPCLSRAMIRLYGTIITDDSFATQLTLNRATSSFRSLYDLNRNKEIIARGFSKVLNNFSRHLLPTRCPYGDVRDFFFFLVTLFDDEKFVI